MPKPSLQRPLSRRARISTAPRRRSIGRPALGKSTVGRDALIAKTCELLGRMPPSRVTRAEVARAMNVDPSLIRYYFRDRSTLLLAAVERLSTEFIHTVERNTDKSDATPAGQLCARASSQLLHELHYPFFRQLILDEIGQMRTPAARKVLQQLTNRGLSAYTQILEAGAQQGQLRAVDPMFLFIAIIGMSQFFVGSGPIQQLVQPRTAGNADVAEQFRQFMCDLLINGLRPRP
jgi:TetR/AcrR family transcriptional regulator